MELPESVRANRKDTVVDLPPGHCQAKDASVISSQEYNTRRDELEVARQNAIKQLRDRIYGTIRELEQFGVTGEYIEGSPVKQVEASTEMKAVYDVGDGVACDGCGKIFKSTHGVTIHKATGNCKRSKR